MPPPGCSRQIPVGPQADVQRSYILPPTPAVSLPSSLSTYTGRRPTLPVPGKGYSIRPEAAMPSSVHVLARDSILPRTGGITPAPTVIS